MEIIEDTSAEKYSPSDELIYKRAKKRARAIKSFYYNLSCYCIVIPVLIIINLTFSPDFYWFLFSATGWGIGLLFHAMGAFNYVPGVSKDWEKKIIAKIMEETNKTNTINMETYAHTDAHRLEKATKRVKAISGFYRHLLVYLLVNIFIIGSKYFMMDDATDRFWEFSTFSTAFFWGMGVAFHAMGIFGPSVFLGKDWEEKKIQQLLNKGQEQKWE